MSDPTWTPGAEIWIISRSTWDDNHHIVEDRVAKVHKNGNFTLISNPKQQYRPSGSKTGESYYVGRGTSVVLKDAESNAAVSELRAASQRARLFNETLKKVERLHKHNDAAKIAMIAEILTKETE